MKKWEKEREEKKRKIRYRVKKKEDVLEDSESRRGDIRNGQIGQKYEIWSQKQKCRDVDISII